jgi:germination protein M
MAVRKRNDKRSGSNAGTVFWLAAVVIVLFIFALNWSKIQETLSRTNFHEIVKTQTGADKSPAAPGASKSAPGGSLGTGRATPSAPAAPPAEPSASVAEPQGAAPKAEPQGAVPKGGGAAQSQDETLPNGSRAPNAAAPASAQGGKTRSATLFFVRIDDDGVIVRQEVKRQVAVSDSPLLDSLSALLKGPSEDEIRKKLISLVPQGTKLLSAQVRGSTAYLNFNEAFMYNHYGIEGYAGQLKQVVYTSTSFPTVQDVQILIEGEKHDYLGGEGVYIGKPLSRNSF